MIKSTKRSLEVSRLVPLGASLLTSSCATESGLRLSLLQEAARRPGPLLHGVFPSQLSSAETRTVMTYEFLSCCPPQPKEGRAEAGWRLSPSP